MDEAKRKVESLIQVFKEGGFPLGKWKTNVPEIADFIRRATKDDNPEILCQQTNSEFLGVSWNQVSDTLFIDTSEVEGFLSKGPHTKRNLLRNLSQIYDPPGLLACVSINFKTLTRVLWAKKFDWDTRLEGEVLTDYLSAVEKLSVAPLIQISRPMFGFEPSRASRELHVFADSSLRAYGAVAYLKEIPTDSSPALVSFLMAKARVGPLKGRWTIHRLELMAALIAAKLARRISENIVEGVSKVYLYSDNSSVLGWLRDSPERWKPFVANRNREIRSITHLSSFSYVRSEDNPADF
ncbi:uncharacterized protein LOC100903882 [Galendromus occidentalis]|uniref:Uncharacterized protein LOC100903882 n=1 Tax=Galendromus occidentalis TaxID=34638 RepID=A0AAJ6VWR5_9ACAR|nr:uncharacterized protein LOC100903882 [Galendromus occidentalis]